MYNSCAGDIAQNIALDCATPNVGGYTGRGLLIPWDNIQGVVQDASNPRIVSSISLAASKKLAVIDNVFAEPFTGSSTASTADSGRVAYTKTVAFRIPKRGAEVSKELVEPLASSANGFLLVLEKQDKKGDGSYEIVGLLAPFRVNGDGINRNELEAGGDISVTGSAVESWFEETFFDTDYATTKAAFETLMTQAF